VKLHNDSETHRVVGFDRITGLHLVGPADVFAAAALEDGNGAFCRAFERNFGLTPSAFRNRREMRGNNVVGNGRSKGRA
jgi:AraC-like DNA-binding protein